MSAYKIGSRIIFLENGTPASGLQHILLKHGEDFLRTGIAKEQVPEAIMTALEKGKIVGYQGRGAGRPIYEYIFQGMQRRIAITVGDNGYIVGANPVSMW